MANDVMRTSAALLYGVSSIALMLANKSLVSVYQFNFPWTVVMQQFACNIVVLIVLRATSVVTWKMATVADLREMLPLAVINCMNVVFGLSAMHGLNLPMLTTLRRISILLTALGEAWILHQRPSTAVMATIALMLLGAFVAALHDLAFDLQAYVLVMMANLATACYVVMIKRVKNRTGMDVFGLLFYNSLLCLPPCLLASLLVGEWPAMRLLVLEDRAGFAIVLVLSLLLATTMSLAVFWNTTVNSPLTQTVTGAFKNLLTVLFSLLLFTDYAFDALNFMGVVLSFAGGIAYAWVKYHEGRVAAVSSKRTQGGPASEVPLSNKSVHKS